MGYLFLFEDGAGGGWGPGGLGLRFEVEKCKLWRILGMGKT